MIVKPTRCGVPMEILPPYVCMRRCNFEQRWPSCREWMDGFLNLTPEERELDGDESDVDGARESSKKGCKTLKNDNQEILIHR